MASGNTIKRDTTLQSPGQVNYDAYSSANAWASMARSGEEIAKAGLDTIKEETHQQQAKAIADFELQNEEWYLKAKDQYQYDPAGFEKVSQAHNDGAISQVPDWLAPHAQNFLGDQKVRIQDSLDTETRSRNKTLAAQSLDARRQRADDDVMAMAMAGKVGTPEFDAAVTVYQGVLGTAASTGLMDHDRAELLHDDLLGRAQGEAAAQDGVRVYMDKGYPAAMDHLRTSILENDKLAFKGGERYKVYNRAVAAVNLQQKAEKADQAGVVEDSRDLRARIVSGQEVDPGEVHDTFVALQRTGATGESLRLSKDFAVRQATAPYRSGALTLGQFGGQIATMRGDPNAPASIRHNNPGAMWPGPSSQKFGSTGSQTLNDGQGNKIATFPTPEAGAAAQFDLLSRGYNGMTIGDAIRKWSGGNSSEGYIDGLKKSGISPETVLSPQTLNDPSFMVPLAKAMAKQEAGREYPMTDEQWLAGFTLYQGGTAAPVQVAQANTGVVSDAQPASAQSPIPPIGAVTREAQKLFVEQAKKAWPTMQEIVKRGRTPDPEDFDAISYAANLSGDADWLKEVNTFAIANGFNKDTQGLPASDKQTSLDQFNAQAAKGGWTIDEEHVSKTINDTLEAQQKQVKDDPVSYGIDKGAPAPSALDFSAAPLATKAVDERVAIAKRVAASEGVPAGSPFRSTERALIASTIAQGKPEQASVAMGVIAKLPDDMLIPALKDEGIRGAIDGAIRTGDPVRFNSAMQFVEQVWKRAPESATQIFGEDAVHEWMTWQSGYRFMTPDQLMKQRDRSVSDPGVRKENELNRQAADEILTKKSSEINPDSIVGKFRSGGMIVRALPFSQTLGITNNPQAPDDEATRNELMSDYRELFRRRYASTLDANKADEQAMALLKTQWTVSDVNGGKLMRYAPEQTYPADGAGNYGWMNKQLEEDLAKDLGPRNTPVTPSRAGLAGLADVLTFQHGGQERWSYAIVADRQTEAEARAYGLDKENNQPPSYNVVVTDRLTGRTDVHKSKDGKDFRYRWDLTPLEKSRADFNQQRTRVFENMRTSIPFSQSFDPSTLGQPDMPAAGRGA